MMNGREDRVDRDRLAAYWRANRRLTALCLGVWALVSFGTVAAAGAFGDAALLGFPLGFLIAAQGAPLVFLLLIALYARTMNRIDRRFDVHEDEEA